MKKIYIILLLLACFVFASCEGYEGQEAFVFIPKEYTFDNEGGDITLRPEKKKFYNWSFKSSFVYPWIEQKNKPTSRKLTEEEEELFKEVNKDKSWCKITRLENGNLHIAVDKNNNTNDRTIIITLEHVDGSGPSWAEIWVWQKK